MLPNANSQLLLPFAGVSYFRYSCYLILSSAAFCYLLLPASCYYLRPATTCYSPCYLLLPQAKHSDWALTFWAKVSPKLSVVARVAASLLPPTHPSLLLRHNDKIGAKVLLARLEAAGGGAEEEQQLLEFWEYCCDLREETKFWESDLVRTRLAGSKAIA